MSTIALASDEPVHIPAGVSDLDRFRQWMHSDEFPQRWKVTFVKGEIILDMSPQEITTHAWVRRDVQGVLWNHVTDNKSGHLHPDGTMFVNEEAGVSTEPDLMFCSWESLRSGPVSYRESTKKNERFVEVTGSPDMVLEVVSDSSVRKDNETLFERYFHAGVLEYWLIDARGDEVDFQLLVRGDQGFEAVNPDTEGLHRSPVFAADFRLTRESDPVGSPFYHLEIRRPTG